MRTSLLSIVAVVSLFTVAGCAAEAGDSSDSTEADWKAGTASRKLSTEFFADKDPKANDPVDYVLIGTNGAKKCLVTIHRRGLSPSTNNWSTVAIASLGDDDSNTTDIGWAMSPDASSSRESIKVTGDELVYKRLPHGQSDEDLTLTAHFEAGKKHGYASLTDAKIVGTNVVGPQTASCESLQPLIVIQDSVVEPITKKAFDGWMKDNDDDTEMDFEGCGVATETTVLCQYGNETNEEQLALTFALTAGKLGKLIDANRSSDF